MSLEVHISQSVSPAEDEKFKSLAQRLSMLLATEGIYIKGYLEGLPYFSRLTEEKKKSVNQSLSFYCELCREQMSEGYTLSDGPSFLWRALGKLGLIPRSDLFQHFDKEAVIEIYSNESVQLFRNLNFFKYCSYSLEELHAKEWWFNYDRDPKITEIIYDYAAKVFSGELKENFIPQVPVHVVKEIDSQDRLVMEVQFGVMGPLFKNKRPVAVIVTEIPRVLDN